MKGKQMFAKIWKGAAAAALVLGMSAFAAKADDKTVTIGHFGNATPMQLVAASDELAKQTGWKVEWRKFNSGAEVIAAMASGDVKLSELGSSPIAIGATQGVELQLFMISDAIGSAEALVARNGSGIEKVEDLKGKTVGVPLGSTSHFSLMGALENAGVAASSVKVVGMSPDQIVAAWSQNQIDAAFIWDPAQSKLRQNGKFIIDAGQVTGKPTYDGWVVNTKFGKDHRDFVVAFVKAIAKADQAYTSNPAAWTADSAAVKTLAERAGAKPEEVPEILKGYGFPSLADQVSPAWLGGGTQKTIAVTAKFLKEQKKISTVLDDYSKFVDPSFIADAMK